MDCRSINILFFLQGLYDSFICETTVIESKPDYNKPDTTKMDKPKPGNTIFVSGHKITEEILRRTFSTLGVIKDISVEPEKKFVYKRVPSCYRFVNIIVIMFYFLY